MFEKITAENGVVFFRSTLLPCPHGFSARIGGKSALAHTSSLNLAFRRGDDEETVLENLRLFGQAVGFDCSKTVSLHQVHSARVREVTSEDAGLGYFVPTDECADGYVTLEKGLPVGVKNADCTPVLFAWVKDGTAQAVAAVHAGWRGTLSEISLEAVGRLSEKGAKKDEIFAAIGPSIGVCCYEVGKDFYDAFREKYGEDFCREFIPESKQKDGKYFAHVAKMNLWQLKNAGIPEENIDLFSLCTSCEEELFYSHRKSRGLRGTMLSVVTKPL